MLNIKKTTAVIAKIESFDFAQDKSWDKFWSTLPVSLSLILMFCWLGNAFAQLPGDFPQPREFDPRRRPVTDERPAPRDISKDVELVGAAGGIVKDVFVQDNYAYICTGGTLTILDVSVPSNPSRYLAWLMASTSLRPGQPGLRR